MTSGWVSRVTILVLTAAVLTIAAPGARADSVEITFPESVAFSVMDITSSTTGVPNPTSIAFQGAEAVGKLIRISVRSESADFVSSGGAAIAASKVSWSTSGAVGGTGVNGTLSFASYNTVFESGVDPTSGGVDVTWSLAAPGAGVRAGEHTLTMRWKVESVVP